MKSTDETSSQKIKDSQRWLDEERFEALMREFCPDIRMVRGPLGGLGYGSSYMQSYSMCGTVSLLVKRILERIEEKP
jgi:hypothetical protein